MQAKSSAKDQKVVDLAASDGTVTNNQDHSDPVVKNSWETVSWVDPTVAPSLAAVTINLTKPEIFKMPETAEDELDEWEVPPKSQ